MLHKTTLIVFLALVPTCSLTLYSQTIEKVHLTTDKNLYAPEDTLWFKAYTFSRDNVLSDNSISLNVVISDTEGNKLSKTSWPILQGMTEGYFVAPKDEGKYILAAISGQMVGSSPDMAFTKSFFVRSELVDDVQLSAFLRSDPMLISDSLVVDVYSRLNPTNPAPDYRFSYELWAGEERLDRGNKRTNDTGEFRLKLTDIPPRLGTYELIVKSNQGNQQGDYQFTLSIENTPGPIDLQFFPEGGELLTGVPNRVAFKAMSGPDRPIDIKALLIGESGQILDTIASHYQGMGSFVMIPHQELAGVRIIAPFAVDSLYTLPKPIKSGVSLSLVAGQDTKPLIRVIPSNDLVGQAVNITIRQFEKELQTFRSIITPRQFFEIPENLLKPGVASVLLTSDSGEPLAERLFFARAESRINVQLSTNKNTYRPREQVIADIEVVDGNGEPVAGSFSISAIDLERSISPVDDQPNLMAQILLRSELKGFIPTPNFYFSGEPRAPEALDLVMLTNGWRKFIPSRFDDAEGIRGSLIKNNNKRKKITDKKVYITDLDRFIPEEVTISGETFVIPSAYFKYKGDSFLITADQEGAKDRFSIKLEDSTRLATIELFSNVIANNQQVNSVNNLYQLPYKLKADRFNNTLLLNTFTLSSNKKKEEICTLEDYHFEKPWTTKMVDELDLTKPGIRSLLLQMDRKVTGFGDITVPTINGIYVKIIDAIHSNERTSQNQKIPFQLYINCEEIPILNTGNISEIPDFQGTKTLESIDFSNLEAISIREGTSLDLPKLVIHTKDDLVNYKPTFEKFKILRTYTHHSRVFYSPIYDTPEKKEDLLPDLRTTIYWQASVITDENGHARVSFYNADRPNKVRITVEGVDIYSNIGFNQLEYQVVEKQQ